MESVTERLNRALAAYPAPPGIVLGDTWLAKQVGASRQQVQHWRNGREPSLEWIERLASALQVESCWLAFGQGPMRPMPRVEDVKRPHAR